MTTIKNRQGNAHVRVSPDQFTANTCVSLDGSIRCVHVPTADLLDALGAVPTADMAREIAEAQREANEWKARAEGAEATIAAVREHVENDDIWWPKSAQREGLRKILGAQANPAPESDVAKDDDARYTGFLLSLAAAVRGGEFAHVTVPVRDGRVIVSEWLTAVALTTTFGEEDGADQ